jgi:NAD(P)-dependent dehydrogenase (short-subunit alcohol dehydrogenase family)
MKSVVLITGCSTGIGRCLAESLTIAGYAVAATARKPETLRDLPAAKVLALDVTQPESVRQAVDAVIGEFGRIDVLINNAGIGIRGAVEELSDMQMRDVFEVNLFGAVRMAKAVAPFMRRQGTGRILQISSILGRLPFPGNGVYSASKFALEAVSDAMRNEMKPFGIHVILIEPGAIRTPFTASAAAAGVLANPDSPYRNLYARFIAASERMHRTAAEPEAVARVVQKAIAARSPRARYYAAVAWDGQLAIALRDWIWDPVVRSMLQIR